MIKKFFALSLIVLLCMCSSRGKRPLKGDSPYQIQQNALFKDGSKSPLKKKDLKEFNGLDFFPIDSTFVITAKLTKATDTSFFVMPTTGAQFNTAFRPMYREYGKVEFSVDGKDLQLTVYQNKQEMNSEKDFDKLFIPFTDDTSGNESYGGGRYMDLFISDISNNNEIILNFNNTYNPYCAYNENYSCPIVPKKNHLDVEIKAGVKAFKNEH